MNHGISALHGSHQVAQKSRRMTFPLNVDKGTSLPVMSFSVKVRFAGFASTGHETPVAPSEEAAGIGRSSFRHGMKELTATAASATTPRTAIAQRIRMIEISICLVSNQ